MTSRPPAQAKYVVIGAGIHGLSTAWNLGRDLRESGRGSGSDVIVIDKAGIGAGPSGIACGVIRNNYYQPAMRELMAHSVSVWESDPQAFSYHPVGYLQISHRAMRDDVQSIAEQQEAIGYNSEFIVGESESRAHMEGIFHDWRAESVDSVLHEKRGGYANNMASLRGLAAKVEAEGVVIYAGIEATGFAMAGGRVTAVETLQGNIGCDHVVVAAGPWLPRFWSALDLPDETKILTAEGSVAAHPTWTFWALQEGTLKVDPGFLTDNTGGMPPVVHIDTDAPLYDDDGRMLVDRPWGVYYKPDFNFGGIQGGYMPYIVDKPAKEVAIDPYGPASPDFVVGEDFRDVWAAALSHCQARFEGKRHLMSAEPSGGIGAFSPDNFPIFDTFNENATLIADSNHGYKMIGVGALIAKEVLGEQQRLLEPFRYSRFARGDLHPVSNSPYPWS